MTDRFMTFVFRATLLLLITTVCLAPMPISAQEGNAAGQRFVPNVLGAWVNLSRRADALAAKRGSSMPAATTCKHHQGLARKDGPDGTPYLFVTRSGNQLSSALCDGGDEPGYLFVIRLASRDKTGERLRTNLMPFNTSFTTRPHLQVDQVVKVIRLNDTFGWPAYRHPGGMQVVGDVLVIGAEEVYGDNARRENRATFLFVDVSDPENPTLLKQFVPPDLAPGADVGCGDIAFGPEHNCAFGTDPVGITAIKAADGSCCRYLMIAAGGPGNAQVRFYRSLPDPGKTTTNLKSTGLAWEMVGKYTVSDIEACLGAEWPESQGDLIQGGQHQMLNFVREDDLDGQLYLIGGRRDGIIANPNADELIDLYKVNLTASGAPQSCPLSWVRSRQMGDSAWGEFQYTGSFSAAAGVYVSPSGELIVYRMKHDSNDFLIFGEFRALSLVRGDSPTLLPTAKIDGPVVVDEGSSVTLNGHGEQAITKAYVQLFDSKDAGTHLDTYRWINIEYGDRDEEPWGSLDAVGFPSDDISEATSSLRWFAPPGCKIAANDYPTPVNAGGWPGPDTVLLGDTGNFEEVFDLTELSVYTPNGALWPVAPAPPDAGTSVDYQDDIGGITFYHQVPFGDATAILHDCDSYYNKPIGISWNMDDDEVYETNGSSKTFSAAQLDGPTIKVVKARAQHPTDTSALGTGTPQPVAIEVRNVAPRLVTATVVDPLGRSLAEGANLALVGLPVRLAIDFTDPGRPDTQTALVTWGDGISNTTFDTFSDAFGGRTGMLRQKHVYRSSGTFAIHAAITDDDLDSTPFDTTVRVLSLEDAMKSIAAELRLRIVQAPNAGVAAALQGALDNLVGNLGGQPPTNGALDKLLANDPVASILKLRAVIAYLISAESQGAGNLTSMKDLLGLIAEGIATTAYEKANTLIPAPSPGQVRTLRTIANLILNGHAQLAVRQYLEGSDSFRQATEKAVNLVR